MAEIKSSPSPLKEAIKKFFLLLKLTPSTDTIALLKKIFQEHPDLPGLIARHSALGFSTMNNAIKESGYEEILKQFEILAVLYAQASSSDDASLPFFVSQKIADFFTHLKNKEALYQAIIKGDDIAAKKILTTSPNLASANLDGLTPLHHAARFGRAEIIALLMTQLSDKQLNAPSQKHGFTALHYAINAKQVAALKILLDNPKLDSGVRDKNDNTLLHYATTTHNIDCTRVLLEKMDRASIHAKNAIKITALHHAIFMKNAAAVEILLQRTDLGIMITPQGIPFLNAIRSGSTELVDIFLKNLPEIPLNISLYDPTDQAKVSHLSLAIELGFHEIVALLLKSKKIKLETHEICFGQTILHHAVIKGDSRMVQLLLAHNISRDAENCDGDTALALAKKMVPPNPEIISILSPTPLSPSPSKDAPPLESKKAPPVSSPAPSSPKTSPPSVAEFQRRWQAFLAQQEEAPKRKIKQGLPEGGSGSNIVALQGDKNRRYAGGLSLADNKSAFLSGPTVKDFEEEHYYYVPNSKLEKEKGIPLYIHITDDVVEQAKSAGVWEANERHLRQGSKFIAKGDENRVGIRKLIDGCYELAIKDALAGDARLFTTQGTFRPQKFNERQIYVFVLDKFAASHAELRKEIASGPSQSAAK